MSEQLGYRDRLCIAVSGPGDGATTADLAVAREVGELVARAGHVVLCGGHQGVMAAVSRGAAEAGGTVIGILPGDDPRGGNEHLTVGIATGMGEMRNALLVRAADAVIVVGGSWGTMSELALAVRTGVPTVAVGGWTVAGGAEDGPVRADSAESAVAWALSTANH